MDAKRFEELSRRVGTAATRRTAVRVLVGGVAASALALLRPTSGVADDTTEVVLHPSIPIFNCRPQLATCHDDRQCCSGHCEKKITAEVKTPSGTLPPVELEGVCDCRPSGATCWRLMEGSFCCSSRCTNEAKCA
jgi:hypothetical protein